jgi:hypothetical protein
VIVVVAVEVLMTAGSCDKVARLHCTDAAATTAEKRSQRWGGKKREVTVRYGHNMWTRRKAKEKRAGLAVVDVHFSPQSVPLWLLFLHIGPSTGPSTESNLYTDYRTYSIEACPWNEHVDAYPIKQLLAQLSVNSALRIAKRMPSTLTPGPVAMVPSWRVVLSKLCGVGLAILVHDHMRHDA